jgi:hypothetical protein
MSNSYCNFLVWNMAVLNTMFVSNCKAGSTPRKLVTATQPWFPKIIISLSWTNVIEWSSENWGNGNATRGQTETLNFLATEHDSLLTIELPRRFLEISRSVTPFNDSFVKMARKVDEAANFVLVQLIVIEPGIYDKSHPDYARRNKIYLAWEWISHETKESGFRLSSFERI